MKREDAINTIRYQAAVTGKFSHLAMRAYTESRISWEVAQKAYNEGINLYNKDQGDLNK